MRDVSKSVIERINREVGTDIKNLHNCKNTISEYAKRVGDIEAEVEGGFVYITEISVVTMSNVDLYFSY